MDKWRQFQAIHFDLNFFDQECCNTQSFKSVGEILSVSIQMKAIEQCFPVQGASNFWVLMSVKSFKCQINWNIKPQAAEASHVSSNFPVAQFIRASYWHRGVLGSNPIEFKPWVF